MLTFARWLFFQSAVFIYMKHFGFATVQEQKKRTREKVQHEKNRSDLFTSWSAENVKERCDWECVALKMAEFMFQGRRVVGGVDGNNAFRSSRTIPLHRASPSRHILKKVPSKGRGAAEHLLLSLLSFYLVPRPQLVVFSALILIQEQVWIRLEIIKKTF